MFHMLGPEMQLGYVVRDLAAAMRTWDEQFGVGPFQTLPIADVVTTYKGQRGRVRLLVALGYRDETTMIELIQPLDDSPSPYKEFLGGGREGLQHFGFWPDDIDAARRHCLERGLECEFSVHINGTDPTHFYFNDPGHIGGMIELIGGGAPKRASYDPIRRMARERWAQAGEAAVNTFYQDKVVLITGAATGMGQASAREFARAGARVVVADWNETDGRATVAEIVAGGGAARFVQVDVSRSASVREMVEQTLAQYGRIDCAFNNAGVLEEAVPLAELEEEVWDRTLGINLKGVWLCMKYELPVMVAQGKGAIVNTASGNAFRILKGTAAYTASKCGVVGLTRMAAVEYGGQGVRVNAIVPGCIDTPMSRKGIAANPQWLTRVAETRPLGYLGPANPVVIAKAAMWLCSDESEHVTGHALPVDAGYLAAA